MILTGSSPTARNTPLKATISNPNTHNKATTNSLSTANPSSIPPTNSTQASAHQGEQTLSAPQSQVDSSMASRASPTVNMTPQTLKVTQDTTASNSLSNTANNSHSNTAATTPTHRTKHTKVE